MRCVAFMALLLLFGHCGLAPPVNSPESAEVSPAASPETSEDLETPPSAAAAVDVADDTMIDDGSDALGDSETVPLDDDADDEQPEDIDAEGQAPDGLASDLWPQDDFISALIAANLDQLLLDVLEPASPVYPGRPPYATNTPTYLELLCRESGQPDYVCRQRYGQ